MEATSVLENLTIKSHRGPYTVHFANGFDGLEKGLTDKEHLLIDTRVAELFSAPLKAALSARSVLKIDALESNKSLERIPFYITHLLEKGIKRDHTLVVVGGGIVQDIAAFIASCLLRGVAWRFYPTTLLAQADSCIGSKSSINVGAYKNQVGTFTPPTEIVVPMAALDSLNERELRSGIGEMIKVHIISGWDDARRIAKDTPKLLTDRAVLQATLRRSLEIKKQKIEIDEFDQKERLIMNYGHTFGHAIESATDYAVPHGIAVTIGMDIANTISLERGLIDLATFEELRPMIQANYAGFERTAIPEDRFFAALRKDKKNLGADISMILLRGPGQVFLHREPLDEKLQSICRKYFVQLKDLAAV